MDYQVGLLCEGLAAKVAHKGLVARVGLLVLEEVGALVKLLATLTTAVRSLSGVAALVFQQVRVAGEAFSTL